MASKRKTEANRKNALQSTGPKTESGKAAVAGNAVKHGAFALAPVIPEVERAEDWEEHLDGIVRSLGPVGTLETRLAERVASLLWRLNRVARYETAVVQVGLEQAAADPPAASLSPEMEARNAQKAAKLLEDRAGWLSETESGLDVLRGLAGLPEDAAVDPDAAFRVLEAVHNELPEDTGAHWVEEPEFLTLLGVPDEDSFTQARWTAAMLRKGLAYLQQFTAMAPEKLTTRALAAMEEQHKVWAAEADQAAAEVRAFERRQALLARRRTARLSLPDDNAEAKILRYEGHLNRQLVQTLHELERIQAGRAGKPVPVPVAVDVGVDVTGQDLPVQ